MSDEHSDIPQDKSFKQTARNEALFAAEKGLKAAQNALSAAEKKLAEAQRNYQNAENNVAAAQSSSAAVENAAGPQEQTGYVPDWQPVSSASGQEQSAAQTQAAQNQEQGGANPAASTVAEASSGSSAAQSEQVYEPPQEPQEPQGQQVPYTPVQPHYEAPYASPKDHVAAGLLAIFLGGFGIHKFYLGYNTQGFIMLAITILAGIFTLGMASGIVWIVAIIEGIIYLTKSQSEFERIYVYGRREWF